MIDKSKLLKHLRVHSTVEPMKQSSRLAQIKLSRLIYGKRDIRNIDQFIKDRNEILRKSKQGNNQIKRIKTSPNQLNKKYDENQLKQLSFQMPSQRHKFLEQRDKDQNYYDLQSIIVPGSPNTFFKRQSIRQKAIHASKEFMLKKKLTNVNFNTQKIPQFMRMKSLTIISQNTKPIQTPKSPAQPLSPLKIRKRLTMLQQPEIKISLKQQQIQKGLNNLIGLINTTQSRNYYIHRQYIFKLLEQRYKLTKETKNASKTLQEIQDENKKNKYYNPQIDHKFHIEIPYCQFVSLKECRASIDRIFNMPLKAAQRIAFKIYDRNANGVIDEKDIIELLTVAQDIQAMQADMDVIIKNYKVAAINNSPSSRGIRYRANTQSKSGVRNTKLSNVQELSGFSLEKTNKKGNASNQYDPKKFRLNNLYTFKQSKQEFFKNNKSSLAASPSITLTWEDFQLAFGNKRPQICFDIFNYLFGLDSYQIYEKAIKGNNDAKSSNRLSIFNNCDGKSEAGSNINLQCQLDSPRKSNKKLDKQKISGISKKRNYQQKEKRNNQQGISKIIGKVRSIEQFIPIKYQ